MLPRVKHVRPVLAAASFGLAACSLVLDPVSLSTSGRTDASFGDASANDVVAVPDVSSLGTDAGTPFCGSSAPGVRLFCDDFDNVAAGVMLPPGWTTLFSEPAGQQYVQVVASGDAPSFPNVFVTKALVPSGKIGLERPLVSKVGVDLSMRVKIGLGTNGDVAEILKVRFAGATFAVRPENWSLASGSYPILLPVNQWFQLSVAVRLPPEVASGTSPAAASARVMISVNGSMVDDRTVSAAQMAGGMRSFVLSSEGIPSGDLDYFEFDDVLAVEKP